MVLPVTDEQAKAIQETAKFGQTALNSIRGFGQYIANVLGTLPEDLVGLIATDPLKHIRIRNAEKLKEKTEKILYERGIEQPQLASPTLAIPLMQAACDESREELQEIWAQLLATAMDPARANTVRRSFIDTVKQMDPLDALVLKMRNDIQFDVQMIRLSGVNPIHHISAQLGTLIEEVEVSVQNLMLLRCARRNNIEEATFFITAYGKLLIKACSA